MSSRELLLDRIRTILVCPQCRGPLDDAQAGATRCPACDKTYPRASGRWNFGGLTVEEETSDWLNTVKAKAKRRLGSLYPKIQAVVGPVYGPMEAPKFIDSFAKDEIICDLGAGTHDYKDRVVCVDGYAYDGIQVVADLARLPFADGSVSGVVSEAVLEHVPDPAAHVAEIRRVLKPGGRVFCYFPFIAAFHASPHDYTRLTLPGLRHLFEGFNVVEVKVAGGPTSGLVWTLQEWLAMAGSFGSERLYRALVPLTWVLSPLKYFDVLLIRHPAAHVIASGFTIEASKP